jgi:hypothetical protein
METDNGTRDRIDSELVCCFLGAVVRQAVLDYNRGSGSQEAEQWLDAELPSWRELAKGRRGPGRPRRRVDGKN